MAATASSRATLSCLRPRQPTDYRALNNFSTADLYPDPAPVSKSLVVLDEIEIGTGDVYKVERLVTKRTIKVSTVARTLDTL